MMSRYFEITGTSKQIGQFERKIKLPVDTIFENVESVLDICPDPIKKVSVLLCNEDKDVSNIYMQRYAKPFDAPAFISLGRMEIVISVDGASLKMFAHEVGHAIVEQYFKPRPPYKMHELMAQYCERHISD